MTTQQPIITDAPDGVQRARKRGPGLRLALLAGLLLMAANPPLGLVLWPLAWVALAPLVMAVSEARSFRQAAWRGYLFGWAFLGPVWYWTGLTIVAWTGSPVGWVAWLALTAILAGFYGAWGGAAWAIARRAEGGRRVLLLGAAWVVMEWARTLGPLSMPWAQLSYTQYRFPPILQFCDLTGAYGLSFLMACFGAGLAQAARQRGTFGGTRWAWLYGTCAVILSFYGWARLGVDEGGAPLTVASMQGNFGTREADAAAVAGVFGSLTAEASVKSEHRPSLYVWSESAAPGDALNDLTARGLLSGLAARFNGAVFAGTRITRETPRAEWNASVLFLPGSADPLRYDKRQLVPFGEFIPFRRLYPPFVTKAFGFFERDVTPGEGVTVLRFPDPQNASQTVALGPFICYESMYPQYARRATADGANLLVTQSNDAWFQSLAAMEQHLAAVTLRAVENRRDVVRATTTGITGFLDSKGRVTARAPRNQPFALVSTVRLRTGLTPYARFGDWFVLLCGGVLAAGAFAQNRRKG